VLRSNRLSYSPVPGNCLTAGSSGRPPSVTETTYWTHKLGSRGPGQLSLWLWLGFAIGPREGTVRGGVHRPGRAGCGLCEYTEGDAVFTLDRRGDWDVLVLSGDLDLAVAPELQDVVIRLLPPDEVRAVAIDLSEVTFIDSTVIGIVAMGHKRAARSGGHLVVVGASGRVERVLELTGINSMLDVRPSLSDLDAPQSGPNGGEQPR
jgi:anti-sigma B factor antagonist